MTDTMCMQHAEDLITDFVYGPQINTDDPQTIIGCIAGLRQLADDLEDLNRVYNEENKRG